VNQEEARTNEEQNLLLKIRRALVKDEESYRKQTDFKALGALLRSNLPETPRLGLLYTQIDLARLSQEDSFRRWQSNQRTSSLLLLSGKNHESATGTGFCWISSAVMVLEAHLMADDPDAHIARYSCCAKGPSDSSPLDSLFSSIIFQVLGWSPGLIRIKYQEYKTRLKSAEWRTEDYREIIQTRAEWLVSILNFFRLSKPVYILLDRIDRALGKVAADDEEEQQIMAVIDALLQIVKNVNPDICVVKILAVSDSNLYPIEQSSLDRLEKQWKPALLASRLDWNQELEEAVKSY
jgi:hypothetical protein